MQSHDPKQSRRSFGLFARFPGAAAVSSGGRRVAARIAIASFLRIRFPLLSCAAALSAAALGAAGCFPAPTPMSEHGAGRGAAPHDAAAPANPADARGASPQPSAPLFGAGGRLPPLVSASPLVELPVLRHGPAVVSLPLGATSRRPVLVVGHGAGDRPEWQCDLWRGIVGDRAFILCPRGFPTNPYVPPEQTGFFYTTHLALGREIELALDALKVRFGDYVDLEAPAYAGFSQGAIMGALILPSHPARFSRAALIEGGYGLFQEWNVLVAERFRRRGGRRVLLACGRPRCVEQARVSAAYMRRAGLLSRVLHAQGAGHSYGGAMEREVRSAFAWVIEGDPRWTLPASAEARSPPASPRAPSTFASLD